MLRRIIILLFIAHTAFVGAQVSTDDFMCPPRSARPSTYWELMNGNITCEGITRDLEYMKQANYGAAMLFTAAVGIPRGNVDYNSPAWQQAVVHAVKEADRLGLRLSMHNAPGYSGTGGAWITPEKSMKQLVWSETFVSGNDDVQHIVLPRPIHKMGFYRDAYIIAFPAVDEHEQSFREVLRGVTLVSPDSTVSISCDILTDFDLSTEYRLEKGASIVFELHTPMTIQAGTVLRGKREKPEDPHDGPRDYAPSLTMETSDDGENYTLVGRFSCPALREMDTPGTLSCPPAKARYIRITTNRGTNLAEIDFHTAPRLEGYATKTNYAKGNVSLSTNHQKIDKNDAIPHNRIIDLTDKTNTCGTLSWRVPHGRWTILRIGYTTTGEEVAAAPDAGKGLECDKFDRSALDLHFEKCLTPLLEQLRPWCGNTFEALVIDSWEAGMQNWSKDFPDYFVRNRGYDILSYLPAVTGRIVDDVNTTERFLWDFRRAQADMFLDNYVKYYKERMAEYGLKYTGEAYGDGNFESLEFASYQDCPMSEFWTHYIYGNITTTYMAASTAHIWGRPIVACECYTGTPFTSKFTEHPYGMKALGDYIMTAGVNRFVYHATTHQPYTGNQPGNMMTMGPFGTHLDRTSTWAKQFGALNLYNARCAYMLQQGTFVADILYLKDEAISSGVNNYNMESPVAPYGYRWDITDASALQQDITVEGGQILFPHGMKYSLLVVAPCERTTPETLLRLIELADKGAKILLVGEQPLGYTGLNTKKEEQVRKLSVRLWTHSNVYHKRDIVDILQELNIRPDFGYTARHKDARIHFIHRACGDEDIYFIANHLRRSEELSITYRIDGKVPYLWNAETGETDIPIDYDTQEGCTRMNLSLDESGSIFVVFRPGKRTSSTLTPITPQATRVYTRTGVEEFSPENDFKSTFTISVWAKPETFAANGRGMLLFPAPGKDDTAKVGFSLGQNGIRVYERTAQHRREVLTCLQPIEGWTHIALVYNAGTPRLYLNGRIVAVGRASKYNCTPSIDNPQAEEQYIATYEGDNTPFSLYNYALRTKEIEHIYLGGLPEPHHEGDLLRELTGPWLVKFPTWSKAPASIQLDTLQSLHRHENFDVKHFSGTATYTRSFTLLHKEMKSLKGEKLFLDLGRVENIAEVIINHSDTLLMWKAPYVTDITPYIRAGENTLTINVTNLYHNRIIGDEYLPERYEYDEYGRIKSLPEWYKRAETDNRERVLFLPWKYYTKDSPLLESGLLGPVGLYIR
ncbi:MAG: hypothetical protein IJY36_01635 [Coprobacter sp.]|nr:hypothetical protein [Coprobacter sp.]